MKKIAIVSFGYEWLPCEPGPSRFYYIAKKFVENGYEVEMIGRSFQHFKKEQRDIKKIQQQNYPFKVTCIDTPSYKKNVDIRRVYSNVISSKNLMKYLSDKTYDVVYCSIPANNVAAKVSRYCKKKEIPFVVDIEDLWPEAMTMVIKNLFIQKLVFPYFKKDAEIAYKNADAAIGTSKDYTDRADLYNKRKLIKETVYVGCDLQLFDEGIKKYYKQITKEDKEFWVTYAGSIGTSYDIKTLVHAAELLMQQEFSNIKIKILGTGPQKAENEALAEKLNCNNIEFLGYVEYQKMAAYLRKSDILINSFVKGAPQSIVNKIGDYLAAGKPMINTLENPEFTRLVDEKKFGVNIKPENREQLAKAIIRIYEQEEQQKIMSDNARKLAEIEFDREVAYQKIVAIANFLCKK